MKRWTIRILMCLILGAISTVAVAWGCAASSRVGRALGGSGFPAPRIFLPDQTVLFARGGSMSDRRMPVDACSHFAGFGLHRLFWIRHADTVGRDGPGIVITRRPALVHDLREVGSVLMFGVEPLFDWSRVTATGLTEESIPTTYVIEDGAGWPAVAIASFSEASTIGGWSQSTTPDSVFLNCGVGPTRFGLYRALPLRPFWPGFLIDTLFYAAIWFGVFFGFVRAQRFIRIRRGRCPRCGYDLRGAFENGCSECGWNREESAA